VSGCRHLTGEQLAQALTDESTQLDGAGDLHAADGRTERNGEEPG
jgi:hypothetical protein